MGTVYEAEQENPRRLVALKVIRAGITSPELLRRFEHEAQVLGRLQHTGIAQVYEAGTADTGQGPQPYFAMEFVRGQTLELYAQAARLSVNERLELVARICDAVEHAHQKGIVHRDLKPGNIMVTEAGQPKILDFGIARATDADVQATRQTEIGSILGTLQYMSPEQASADPTQMDTRSDVYALGVILYELLASRLPHILPRQNLPEALRILREDDASLLSSVSREFRGDLETITAKALAKEKERRYQSAADLAADLRRHLRHEPIVARPASTAYQLAKFARRNRVLVGGIAAVFLALLGGFIVSSTLYVRADAARIEAKEQARIASAVNDFLNRDLLESVDPRNTADREITMRAVLDKAARRIGDRFGDQPLVEAAIRRTIGTTYVDLGLSDVAEEHLLRAQELVTRLRGERHRESLALAGDVAGLRYAQGRLEEAEKIHVDLRRRELEILGPEAEETLLTTARLGTIYCDLGRFDEAEPLLREAVATRRRVFGIAVEETLTAMDALAVFLADRSQLAEAEALYVETLALERVHLGVQHPRTLCTQSNFAWLYVLQKRFPEAASLLVDTVAVERRVFGDAHTDTLTAINNLAVAYTNMGRSDLALPLYLEDYEASVRTLGEEHPETLVSATNLGSTYLALKRFDDAAHLLERTVANSRKVLGPGHYGTGFALCAYGDSLTGLGRYAEAEAALLEARGILLAMFGAGDPNLSRSENALIRLYEQTGRTEDAAKLRGTATMPAAGR